MGKVCPATNLPPFITIHGDQDSAVPYTGGDLAGFPLGIPAVEDRTAEFAAKEGCTAGPAGTSVAADVVHIVWECPEGKAAEIYKVLDGGHAWPGAAVSTPGWTQSIDASDVILDFFDAHPQAAD
jgi:polyhydroxybutyrate depolymerase